MPPPAAGPVPVVAPGRAARPRRCRRPAGAPAGAAPARPEPPAASSASSRPPGPADRPVRRPPAPRPWAPGGPAACPGRPRAGRAHARSRPTGRPPDRRPARRRRASRTTARQAIPSTRPRAPEALGPGGLHVHRRPTTADQPPAIRRCGRQPGPLADHRAVGVHRHPARLGASATTWASRSRESAPAQRGSVSGKWRPRSPRPAAPRRASARAWATTSASLWPASPAPPGDGDPAEDQGPARLAGEAVDVEALTDPEAGGRPAAHRRSCTARSSSASARARSRGGHLQVPRVAGHDAHGSARASTSPASSVASPPSAWAGPQHVGPERLGGLHRHQPVPVDGGDHHAVARPASRCRPPAAPGRRRRRRRHHGFHHGRNSAAEASGRAPSWTTITAGLVGHGGQPGPHRGRPGGAHRPRPRRRQADRRSARRPEPSRRRHVGRDHEDHAVGHRPGRLHRPVDHGRPASSANCLGPPNRRRPPATTTAQTGPARLRAAPRRGAPRPPPRRRRGRRSARTRGSGGPG